MKFMKSFMAGTLLVVSAFGMQAQSLGDILSGLGGGGNSGSGNLLSNVLEGVFTKTNLTVADLVGDYQAQGPAVTFQSENFLQKAGGIAGAAAIESKLNPYYQQYGLNNMTLAVTEDGNFTMKIKGISLKGNLTQGDEQGTFNFNFNVLGINLGSFKAYVEKSGSNLNVMFDATKLKSFISTVAKLTGNSMASTVGSILDSYEGACIGWKMVSTSQNTNTDDNSNTNSAISSGLDALKGILNGGN